MRTIPRMSRRILNELSFYYHLLVNCLHRTNDFRLSCFYIGGAISSRHQASFQIYSRVDDKRLSVYSDRASMCNYLWRTNRSQLVRLSSISSKMGSRIYKRWSLFRSKDSDRCAALWTIEAPSVSSCHQLP